jgi:DNA-directed RNA polymerase specialized sigma24 family protein
VSASGAAPADGDAAGSLGRATPPTAGRVGETLSEHFLAFGRIVESYRDVHVLADVEGLPNAEVADVLGLTGSAVKARLHRARLLMRKVLAPYFAEVTTQ